MNPVCVPETTLWFLFALAFAAGLCAMWLILKGREDE